MTFELHATPEDVMRAVAALEAFGQEHRVADQPLHRLMLALEECASNIVNHALRRDPQQTFRIGFAQTGNSLIVTLRDRGPAFDPTEAPLRVPRPEDATAEVGGWGIQMARKFADELRYTREHDENVLRLVKHLSLPP